MNSTDFVELIPYDACPLCGATALEVEHQADCSQYPHYQPPLTPVLVWMRCRACRHSFRSGFYTDAAFQVLFQKTHDGQQTGQDYERQRHVWGRVIQRVLPHRQSGLWIDIGFGNGALLLTAAEYGFVPYGCDLRQANVEALRGFGIQADCADFTQLSVEPKASVISMCDVLEHMQFPLQGLSAAHRNLIPEGVLVLSMPNRGSPLWRLLDQAGKNPYWGEMEHFHNFSRESLYRLLEAAGFTPLEYGISERYRACMEVLATKTPAGSSDDTAPQP